MGKILQPRQSQALLKPCPSPAHAQSASLVRQIGRYSTALYVAPLGDRLRWCATVALLHEGMPMPLASLGPKALKEMETLAREMMYLKEPRGHSIGKGNHDLAPGQVAINLYRELDDDEKTLLPADWQEQPTDQQIIDQQRRIITRPQ